MNDDDSTDFPIVAGNTLRLRRPDGTVADVMPVLLVDEDGRRMGIPETPLVSRALTQTLFGESLVAERRDVFNLRPMFGVSRLRDKVTTTGSATVDEVTGQIQLDTTAAAGDSAIIRTLERGNYLPGTTGQMGVGISFTTAPSGDAFARWGYYDGDNGLGFGRDATGMYVFTLRAGTYTRVYQSAWNLDKLDGTGNSGIDFDFNTYGAIYQADFTWYGYGDIEFAIYALDESTGQRVLVNVHRVSSSDSNTILVDPNQPIRVELDNGTDDTAMTLRMGGRQFSVLGDAFNPPDRPFTTNLVDYTITAATGVWEPLIALRKKSTFRGRQNSIRVVPTGYRVSANENVEVRLTLDATTSAATYGAPSNVPASETAVEVADATSTLTTSDSGVTTLASVVDAGKKDDTLAGQQEEIPIGNGTEVVLWARRRTASATIVSATLTWDERW